MTTSSIEIRNYRPVDVPALVELINQADAIDRLERATTIEQMEHEMSFPSAYPETDCFLAWDGYKLVGYTDIYVRAGDADNDGIAYCWGVVHPSWRRRGIGRQLLETAYDRARERLREADGAPAHLQCGARELEAGCLALYRDFGMEPVRYFVNLARPLDGELPQVALPAGIRLRVFDPERDAEAAWRVDLEAFRDHWGYTQHSLDEFLHWIKLPSFRADLSYLALEENSDRAVGVALNLIDENWIAQTGRQEGYVDTLAVLREHRLRGLGSALLAQSLHALSGVGMEAAHLHADADNLTGAMRLYERAGFRVRKTSIAFRKPIG